MKALIAVLCIFISCPGLSADYIKSWLVCGPFIDQTLDDPCFDNEGKSVPVEGASEGGNTWRRYLGTNDFVDLAADEVFGQKDESNGMAYVRINCAAATDAILYIGSDDGVRVWLNGEMVLNNDTPRGLEPDQDIINIRLKDGDNNLLAKVNNIGGGWGLSARIGDRDGNDIKGLKYFPVNTLMPLPVLSAKASSEEEDESTKEVYNAWKAFDGDMSTRWSSQHDDSEVLTCDLGRTAMIYEIVLNWETAFGKSYSIDVSPDESDWIKVYSTEKGSGGREQIKISPVKARYVRLSGKERGTTFGYSLFEFAVVGEPLTGKDEKIILKKN
ncbi:MAG: discoidin domain-containing protein [Elusimicrobiota bacterium]